MVDDDVLSFFTYDSSKLKRSVNKKLVQNIDLDENIDNFLNARLDISHPDNLNFFQRFRVFLEKNHEETKRQLMSDEFKNLIVAFTSKTEWAESKMDPATSAFIERMSTEYEEDDAYKLCVIIVVFPDQQLLEGKSVYYNPLDFKSDESSSTSEFNSDSDGKDSEEAVVESDNSLKNLQSK